MINIADDMDKSGVDESPTVVLDAGKTKWQLVVNMYRSCCHRVINCMVRDCMARSNNLRQIEEVRGRLLKKIGISSMVSSDTKMAHL